VSWADKTPFDLSWENEKRDVASFLARRSGNVRALDTVSSTPSEAGLQSSLSEERMVHDLNSVASSSSSNSLHSALTGGQIGFFQRLVDQGADVDELERDILRCT
jgi:hypothetical protein